MTIDVAGFNGKRHWAHKQERGEQIVERLSSGATGADILGGNELDAAMCVGMRRAGFAVFMASSNDKPRRPWSGNAIAWNPKEYTVIGRGEMRVPFRYWPGKKFKGRRFVFWKKLTVYFPWVRLRNKHTGERVVVMVVHFPTPFNAKPRTREWILARVRTWLGLRRIAGVVIGDTNRLDLTNPRIRKVTVKDAVGIWINGKVGVRSIGTVNLAGLSDHPHAPRARLTTNN